MQGTSLTSAWSATGLVVSGVAEAELGRVLGGAAAARLAVLADDLDLIGTPAALQALGQDAADLFEDETVGFAEARERTRLGADVTDLDDAALSVGRNHPQHRRRRDGAEAGAHQRSARNAGVKIVRCVLRHMRLRCRVRSRHRGYSRTKPAIANAQPSAVRAFLRCCSTFARSAACASALQGRKPSPDLKPSLPFATSASR